MIWGQVLRPGRCSLCICFLFISFCDPGSWVLASSAASCPSSRHPHSFFDLRLLSSYLSLQRHSVLPQARKFSILFVCSARSWYGSPTAPAVNASSKVWGLAAVKTEDVRRQRFHPVRDSNSTLAYVD